MKKLNFSVLAACLVFGFMVLAFVSCKKVTDYSVDWRPYRVVFDAGEGGGVPPQTRTVPGGTEIRLPGIEAMVPPAGKVLSGWRTGGINYNVAANYTVRGDVIFTAQWGNPGNTTGAGPGINMVGTWRSDYPNRDNSMYTFYFYSNWTFSLYTDTGPGGSWEFDASGTYSVSGNTVNFKYDNLDYLSVPMTITGDNKFVMRYANGDSIPFTRINNTPL